MQKFSYNQLLQYFVGLCILTLGLATMITTAIGPTPWDSVSIGIATIFNVSVGIGTTITGICIVVFVAIVTRTRPNIIVILISFVTGMLINFWLFLIDPINISEQQFELRFFLSFLGLVLCAIGINLYVKANVYPNPIDFLMVTFNKHFKIRLLYAKLLTDLSGITIGLILGGPVTWFTIVVMLLLGTFVGIFEKVYYLVFTQKK